MSVESRYNQRTWSKGGRQSSNFFVNRGWYLWPIYRWAVWNLMPGYSEIGWGCCVLCGGWLWFCRITVWWDHGFEVSLLVQVTDCARFVVYGYADSCWFIDGWFYCILLFATAARCLCYYFQFAAVVDVPYSAPWIKIVKQHCIWVVADTFVLPVAKY